jgi:hypothetical protein
MFNKDDIKSLVYAGLFVVAVYASMYGLYYFAKFIGIYEQFRI